VALLAVKDIAQVGPLQWGWIKITEPGTDEAADGIVLGDFATEREAALAYDRAAVLLYGDKAETNFSPEESEHLVLSDEVMRQSNALKAGRGMLQ
jgi:hypothetical protein